MLSFSLQQRDCILLFLSIRRPRRVGKNTLSCRHRTSRYHGVHDGSGVIGRSGFCPAKAWRELEVESDSGWSEGNSRAKAARSSCTKYGLGTLPSKPKSAGRAQNIFLQPRLSTRFVATLA